jgi:hypothetical protein
MILFPNVDDRILVNVNFLQGDDMPISRTGVRHRKGRHVLVSGRWCWPWSSRAVTSRAIAGEPVRAWLAPRDAEAEPLP